MKALLAGQRQGSVGVVAGLLALLCLAVSCAGLILKQMRDLHDIKQILVSRCEKRQASDDRAREDLQGRIDLYASVIKTEQENPFISDDFRQRRIAPYRVAMDAAAGALTAIPPRVNCAHVYARDAA